MEARRKALRLTQDKLAEKIGVTVGAYQHWLSRRRVPDKLEAFETIARATGTSPAWLLYGAYDVGEDPMIEHMMAVMQEMPDYKKAQAAKIIDTLAEPDTGTDGPNHR